MWMNSLSFSVIVDMLTWRHPKNLFMTVMCMNGLLSGVDQQPYDSPDHYHLLLGDGTVRHLLLKVT